MDASEGLRAGVETWVPCLVLAHLLSFFFVAKSLAVLHPQLWRRITIYLLSLGACIFIREAGWLAPLRASPLQCARSGATARWPKAANAGDSTTSAPRSLPNTAHTI